MAAHDALIFRGRKWQALRVTERGPLGRFAFTAGGDGREWNTEKALMFWRTFAELDPNNIDAALDFIRRHGDPFGELDREERAGTTAKWPSLRIPLEMIAQAWDDEESDDETSKISRLSNDPDRREGARHALYELSRPDLKGGLEGVEVIAHGDGFEKRATSLATFMILSAGSALSRRVVMRTCDFCGEWFELRKATARFCSGSCQAIGHKHKAIVAGPKSDLKKAIVAGPNLKTAFRKLKKGRPHGPRR